MTIGNRIDARGALVMLGALFVLALGIAGCGDNKDTAGTKTGPGATAGATGDAAGGVAVEAGKQRDPKDVANEKKHFSSEPPPVQVLVGASTGYYVNKNTVVIAQSGKQLKAMEKKHFQHGVQRDEIAPVDFKTRQVIGLFLPPAPRGSQLAVTNVTDEGDKVKVEAVMLLNGKGCKVPPGGKPRPFHMVETRKMKSQNGYAVVTRQKTTPCK